MAGNIIPAIATANAIIAGQIVIHALRILRGKYEKCQNVFLRSMPNHKGGVLVKDKCIQPPNPKCNVCSSDGEIVLITDVNNFTVRQLEDLVLKKKLNMVAPDVTMVDRVIISSDEADEVNMYDKTLSEVGMTNGSSFMADDYFQNYGLKIMIYNKEKSEEEEPDFEIVSNMNDLQNANEIKNKTKPYENEEDDCVIEKAASPAGSIVSNNYEDTVGAVNHVMVDGEGAKEMGSGDEGAEKMGSDEGAEEINNEGGAEEINNEESAEEINNEGGAEEDCTENNSNEEVDCTKNISNEKVDAEEISNEEILAIKRKADEAIEDINDAKKSRVD